MKTVAGAPVVGHPPDVLRHLGAVLLVQWRRYRKRFRRCQQEFSEAAVHDSRIETRRLLATLELLAAFLPASELKKPRRALKKHLDAFDQLRDTQVQLGCVAPVRRVFPAAQEFYAWLRQREVRFIWEACRAVKRIKIRRVERRLVALEGELRRQQKRTPPERACFIANRAVRLAYARVARLCRRVNAADLKTIHRARIAFKRFRYMVETLSPLLPAVTDRQRRAMRSYQAMMGGIQDLKVLLVALDQFIESEADDPATQRLRAEFVRQRIQLVREYFHAAPRIRLFCPPKTSLPRRTTKRKKLP